MDKKYIGLSLDAVVFWKPPTEIDRDFYIRNLPELVELCMVSEGQVVDDKGQILAKYDPDLGMRYSPKFNVPETIKTSGAYKALEIKKGGS